MDRPAAQFNDPLKRAVQAAARQSSIRQLARALGVHRATLTRIIKGRPVRDGSRVLLRAKLGLPIGDSEEGGK